MAEARERGQWTLKHKAFVDPELRIMLRKAAERQGMQLMDFVVETLRGRAHDILTGGGPPASPPARPEDLIDTLTARLLADMSERMAAMQREMAAQADARLAEIERRSRLGRWRR